MRHWRCFFSSAFLVDLVTWSCPFLLFVNVLLSNAQFCRTHVDISAWQDQSSCVYAWFNTLAVSLPSGSSHFVAVCICKCQEIWGILPNISSYVELVSQTSSPWSWGFCSGFPARLLRGMQTCPKNFPFSKISAVPLSSLKHFISKNPKKKSTFTRVFGIKHPLVKTSLNWKLPWKNHRLSKDEEHIFLHNSSLVEACHSNLVNGWLAGFVFLPNQWSNGQRNSDISYLYNSSLLDMDMY